MQNNHLSLIAKLKRQKEMIVCHCTLNSLYVSIIIIIEKMNVNISDTGIEYNTPSRPKNIGNTSAKPTPNKISLIIEIIVDATTFPKKKKKIKVALFTHAKIIIHK